MWCLENDWQRLFSFLPPFSSISRSFLLAGRLQTLPDKDYNRACWATLIGIILETAGPQTRPPPLSELEGRFRPRRPRPRATHKGTRDPSIIITQGWVPAFGLPLESPADVDGRRRRYDER